MVGEYYLASLPDPGGRVIVDWLAGCSWNQWPNDRGIRTLAVAHLFGLSHGTEFAVLDEVKSAVVNWKIIAKFIGMSAVDISSFAPAFEHPEL